MSELHFFKNKAERIKVENCLRCYPDDYKSTASKCDDDEPKDHFDQFEGNQDAEYYEDYYGAETCENIIIIEEEQINSKNIKTSSYLNKEYVKTKKINKSKFLPSINRKIFKSIGNNTSSNSFIKKEIKKTQKNIEYPEQWDIFVSELNFKNWIIDNKIEKNFSSLLFFQKFWDYVNDDSISWKIKHFKAVLANYILSFIKNDAKNWVENSKKIISFKNSENYVLIFEILKSEILKKI